LDRRITTPDVKFNGETAVFVGIWVLPTANSLDVIGKVRDALPGIQAQLPVGMKAGIPYDATEYIKDAIHEVLTTLTETLLIVILVIFLFLGSFRSVVIPVVAIPVSLVGAVFLMLLAGFTINLLTLLAIVLSVGLVVDDAIVMVENVERHIHSGKRPHQAALEAARELVGPIIAMTITLAAVYAPIGIQGGLTGTLFREFAFTLAGAVIVSGVVALTLSPMMGAKLLKPAGHRARIRRMDQPAIRKRAERIYARARVDAALQARRAHPLGHRRLADRALLHVLAARTGACRGSGRGLLGRAGRAKRDDRADQAVHVADSRHLPRHPGKRGDVPAHFPKWRLRRHGHQAVE
jgi:multidrug efflux pump